MADDALTRKEAEMGRMTRERIEQIAKFTICRTDGGGVYVPLVPKERDALCDLALRALSLESVREEALEEAAKVCEDEPTVVATFILKAVAAKIRALQHAPARVAEGGLTPEERRIAEIYMSAGNSYPGDQENAGILARACLRLSPSYAPESPAKEQPGEQSAAPQVAVLGLPDHKVDGPAAAAPDVAAMVKRLRAMRQTATSLVPIPVEVAEEAAALIEKLGQRMNQLERVLELYCPNHSLLSASDLDISLPPPERP